MLPLLFQGLTSETNSIFFLHGSSTENLDGELFSAYLNLDAYRALVYFTNVKENKKEMFLN